LANALVIPPPIYRFPLIFGGKNAEKRGMAKGLFLTILLASLPAWGARVVKVNQGPPFHVILDNSVAPPFDVGQELCVKFHDRRGICGVLFAKKGRFAAVRFRPGFSKFTRKLKLPLDALPPELMKTQQVALIRVWQRTPGRDMAGGVDGPIIHFEGNPDWEKRQKVGWPRAQSDGFHPSNHISLGVNYLSPFMRYEVAVGTNWALGLKMQYAYMGIPGGNLSGYGGIFAASYYSVREFKGLWLYMGGGFYSLTAKVGARSGTFSSPALSLLAGWKWSWKNNLSFGFGFGSELVFKTEPAGFAPTFSGAMPVILLDFGIVF